MDFESALKLVGLAEGGYTNDPNDSGGETICGLARNKNPDLSIWQTVDEWKARGVTGDGLDKLARADIFFMQRVHAAYRGRYWVMAHCDDVPPLLRYPLFSCCVNCGAGVAVKLLQKAAGVKADGKFGPYTYKAVWQTDVNILYNAFMANWRAFYRAVVREKPAKGMYLNGWLNRIDNVMRDNVSV